MDSSKLLREVLRAVNQYRHNKNGQVVYLLQQLEALQSISSRSSYIRQLQCEDPVELVECLSFLAEMIQEPEQQELLQKSIKIMLNLSHDEGVRKMMYDTFNLCSPMAAVVLVYSNSPEEQCLSDVLQLIQRITYGYRVDYHQPNMEDLLIFLIKHILSGTDVLISPVLGIAANLCRNNLLVQSAIRNIFSKELGRLWKALCRFIDDDNQMLAIFSLSIFTSLSLNESDGQKVFFASGNVEQTLQTIFSIIVNRFKTVTWKYAADLLSDLLRHPQMQNCIRKYRHLTKCVNDTMSLLSLSSEDSAPEIFQLLHNLSSVASVRHIMNVRLFTPLTQGKVSPSSMSEATQKPLSADMEPLLCCIHWSAQTVSFKNSVACAALNFIADSVQDTLWDSESSYPVHLLAPVFAKLLSVTKEAETPNKTYKLVRVLTVLCSNKLSRECLGSALTLDTISILIESQLSKNNAMSSYISVTSHLSRPSVSGSENESTNCVLPIIDLSWKLHKQIPGINEFILKTLKEPKVLDLLAMWLTSSCQSQVEMALKLFAITQGVQDVCPDVGFCGSVARINQRKERSVGQMSEPVNTSPSFVKNPLATDHRALANIENRPVRPIASSSLVSLHTDTTFTGTIEGSLENLIEKMQDVMEPKDKSMTSVLEILESHIKLQRISEEHLKNLLDAKNLALTQADRVITQSKGRQASLLAEMRKLQNILKESERKNELLIIRMNDMRIEMDKLQSQFDKQLMGKAREIEAVAKENSDLNEKCVELDEKINSCKQEMKTLSAVKDDLLKAHEVLKDQYYTSCNQSRLLEEERKVLSKQLKERDASVQKLSSSLQSVESKYNDTEKERAELEKEKDDMEAYIDKLRNQLSSSENSCKQLQQWNKALEGCKQELGDKLKEKSDRIEVLEEEVEKHNQIISFINNMHLKGGKK